MAEIKRLQLSDGVTVTAPTGLSIDLAKITDYVDDATFLNNKSGGAVAVNGDVYLNTTSGFIRYYFGTWHDLVNNDTTQTITNKAIDGANNAISNISNPSLLAGIDAVKIGAGDVDDTELSTLNGVTSSVQTQLDSKVPLSQKSAVNGVASLDASGKVPTAELPSSVLGTLQYQGSWDASTNTPTLSSGTGTQGYYYVVSVAGSTALDGISDWQVGDWVTANTAAWEKIDNTDKVSSVAGKIGAVSLDLTDVDNGGSLTAPSITESVALTEQAVTPTNPSAGAKKLYAKTDGKMYTLNDVGVEVEVGSGAGGGGTGSGEINYISNPSAAIDLVGWTESNAAAMNLSRTAVAGELPREFLTGSGLKFVATSSAVNTYVSFPFNMDDTDLGKLLKVDLSIKALAGYVSDDYLIQIHDGTNVIESTPVKSSDTRVYMTFASGVSALELRVVSTVAASTGVVISDVVVGPGKSSLGARVEPWQVFAPTFSTGSLGPNTESSFLYKRVGDSMQIHFALDMTSAGVSGSGDYLIDIPDGKSIDTNLIKGLNIGDSGFGEATMLYGPGGSKVYGYVTSHPTGKLALRIDNAGTEGTWGSGFFALNQQLRMRFTATVPIAEWAGSGTINLLSDQTAKQLPVFKSNVNTATTATTLQPIVFNSVKKDSSLSYDNTTGVYTVKQAGDYKVFGQFFQAAAANAAHIYLNGVNAAEGNTITSKAHSVSAILTDLVEGNTIDIRAQNTATLNTGAERLSYFSVVRIPDFTAGSPVGIENATASKPGLVRLPVAPHVAAATQGLAIDAANVTLHTHTITKTGTYKVTVNQSYNNNPNNSGSSGWVYTKILIGGTYVVGSLSALPNANGSSNDYTSTSVSWIADIPASTVIDIYAQSQVAGVVETFDGSFLVEEIIHG